MNKKKILSILASMCMVFTMVLSLNLNVFALSENDTQEVTVTGVQNDTELNAYQIISVNVDSNGNLLEPTYTWAQPVADWIKSEDAYKGYVAADGSVAKEYYEKVDGYVPDRKAFLQDLASVIRDFEITPVTKTSTSETTTLTLGMGSYLVLASGGTSKTYSPTVANVLPVKSDNGFTLSDKGNLQLKSEDLTIEKDVEDATVGIGDKVTYKVDASVTNYPDNASDIYYAIGDTMGKGLTYNNDVKAYSDKDCTVEIPTTNYTLTTEKNGFKLTFNSDYIKNYDGNKIYVKYTATVNEEAVSEETNKLKNTAKLEFSTDPYNTSEHKIITDDEDVYTYNISFEKENDKGEELSGAKFKLSKNDTDLTFIGSDGDYRLAKVGENGTSELTTASGSNLIKIDGLDTGTYELVETQAPAGGYVLPTGNKIEITLEDSPKADGNLDKATAKGTNIEVQSPVYNGLNFSFTVINKTADDLDLPVTGGTGTMMYTLGGLAIMGGAVYLFLSNKKKQVK